MNKHHSFYSLERTPQNGLFWTLYHPIMGGAGVIQVNA